MTTKQPTTNTSPLWFLPSDALFPFVLDFLDEASLSHLACVERNPELQLRLSAAWICLAMRRCCSRTAKGGDGNKGFPTAAIARAYLKARHKQIQSEMGTCFSQRCDNQGILRCPACNVVMYCSRYV